MGRTCSTYEIEEIYMQGFGGKLKGKRSLGRPRRRSKDNIKQDLQDVGWGRMDWFHLAQDGDRWRALICKGGNEFSVFIKFGAFRD
jgi:hypothetical protein